MHKILLCIYFLYNGQERSSREVDAGNGYIKTIGGEERFRVEGEDFTQQFGNAGTNPKWLYLFWYLEKFTDRILDLNQKGVRSAQLGNYEQALLYLAEAEKLLEYAASCGRALDREVILKVLKNEAMVYQKTWDL